MQRLLRGLHRLHFRLAAGNTRNAGADAVGARFHRLRHIQRACRIAARSDHGLVDEFSAAVVKTIDHTRRLLIRQAQLNGQWLLRRLAVLVMRARHAQAHPEIVPHAGCCAHAIQPVKNHLRRNHFHRHCRRCHAFCLGFYLRAAQTHARDRDVGVALIGFDGDALRHAAYVLRYAAQAHRHGIAACHGLPINHPHDIQLIDVHLQALAYHQLAQTAFQAQLHRLLRGLHCLHFRLTAGNARNAGADAVGARFHRLRHIQRACRIAARRDHGLADEFSAAVVKTIDHARRLLIRQAQLNGQWPIRRLVVLVMRARHAQAHPEIVPHAGCRARAIQPVKNHLRRNHFHRHRHCRHAFGLGFNLRAAQANARDRNVGIVLAGLDDDRFRHAAYVLRHAAQAHHHRLACRSGFAIDQPLHIQLVGIHLQALAHHCLAPPAFQA